MTEPTHKSQLPAVESRTPMPPVKPTADAFSVLNGIIEKVSDVSADCASVIDSEMNKLRSLVLQMRCCQNCVNTPFNGLNYHTHCGHWLKRECSENRGHPFYMRKWEFGELDGRQNRERKTTEAETEV